MGMILVVEDHAPTRKVIAAILEKMGHEVLRAANGLEAMRLQLETPADLVLTDLFMPEVEGLETIQKMRKLYPNVQIIAVSGGSARADLQEFLQMARKFGANQVLQKPFTPQQLIDGVTALGFGAPSKAVAG
jgi:CheY-like chemotaxis protein